MTYKTSGRRGLGLATVPVMLLLASCIDNPGPFTIAFDNGSVVTLEDQDGNEGFLLDVGGVACVDGLDNDADDLYDADDPECDATNDMNERLDGVQAFTETTLPVDIDGAGTITYDPTDFAVAQREECLSTTLCLGLTMRGVGTTETGSFDAGTVSLPISIVIDIDPLVGFGDLPSSCTLGPIDATWVADNYDLVSGVAHMEALDSSVPAVTTCDTWNDAINWYLNLPTLGNAVMETTILDAFGNPIDPSD